MNLSIGIVGLPNVGKSTLFNALLKKQQAFVANYPFATIEPNIGIVPVPDERLTKLAEIEKSEKIVPATVKFVDIAGLVKGAAEGQGLGNKFLAHVRECNTICQVVRHFSNKEVVHVSETSNPQSDFEVVNTELILADLQTLEKSKSKDQKLNSAIEKLKIELNKGKMARDVQLTDEEKEIIVQLQLLTMKPQIVVLNIGEEDYGKDKIEQLIVQYTGILDIDSTEIVLISAKIESELAGLSEEEQKAYLKELGIEQSGLERLIQKAYARLELISFLTAGEKEARAWTIKRGTTAQDASGTIHTDFVVKFIKAEVLSYDYFVTYGGWKKARELGKTRFEGRDYIVKDGDVIEFKIGT